MLVAALAEKIQEPGCGDLDAFSVKEALSGYRGGLKASLGDAVVKIGMGAAMKNKWLRKEGTVLKRALAGVVDEVQAQLREIQLAGGVDNSVHQPQSKKGYFLKRKADDMSGDDNTSGDHAAAKCGLFGITSSELRAPSSAPSASGSAYPLPSEQLSLGPAKGINTYDI